MYNKKMRWFYPSVAIGMFATLLIALLIDYVPDTAQIFWSTSMGMISFVIMLTLVMIAVRPKAIEQKLGLTEMYEVHAWMAMALPVTLLIHVTIRWSGLDRILSLSISDASILGYVGLITLFFVMITGIFVLSDTLIKKSKKLMDLKENFYKRNTHLWIHRLAIVSIIAIHFHVYEVYYLRDNIPFRVLTTGYTLFVLGWYAYYKIKTFRLPKYSVSSLTKPTSNIHQVEMQPADGEMMDYRPGQYGFFRFVDSEVTGEPHPFSISSARSANENKIQIMVKEDGDFTSNLGKVDAGDKVTIEGPYGNFYPEEIEKNQDIPIVLLSGGIGVTPNFSVLRHEVAMKSDRRIVFIWGLAYEDDMMYIDELDKIAEEFPNFSYHLAFSEEEVEGYPHGFIDQDFMEAEGLDQFFETAHFHVCGPPPMLEAAKGLLADNDVGDDQASIEEFAF